MELKSRITELLNSELEILAYEQKKINEYKVSENPSQKAIETRQRIINTRLNYFNELKTLIDLTDSYFNTTINMVVDGAAKGYYLPDKLKDLLNKAIRDEIKNFSKKGKIYEACCNSFLTIKPLN